MEKKKLILAIFVIFAIFLSGCYSLTVEQSINEDGSMDIKIIYDLSAMMDMASSMGDIGDNSTEDSSQEFLSVCDNFSISDSIMTDATCSATEGFIMTISGKVPAERNTAFKKDGGNYIYNAKDVYNYIPDLNMEDAESDTALSDQTLTDDSIDELSDAKDMLNIGLTYVLTMPAEITESDLGTIEGNTVTMDMFEMTEMDEIIVTAKAPGFNLFGFGIYELAIGGIVLALIIVVLVILLMKHGHHGPSQTDLTSSVKESDMKSQPSENVRKLTSWLNQYSHAYSDEVLKRQMMNQGHPMSDIEEAFRRREPREPSLPSDL
jgi:hypothetical protein